MAKKVRKQKRQAESSGDELGTLIAQQVLPIDGKQITVHGITMHESLMYRPLITPLVESLRAIAVDALALSDLDRLLDTLAEHTDAVEQLIAISCDQPVEWVKGLKSEPGETLLFAWWVVNSSFFIRHVMRPIIQAKMQQAGQTSLQPSSHTDTTQTDSLTTPVAS